MGKLLKRYYCCLFVFLSCVASCASKRTITQTHEENAIRANYDTKIGRKYDNEITATIENVFEKQLGTVRTITFRIYDTEKDADENGQRPLLAEGIINEETNECITDNNTQTVDIQESVSDSTLTRNEIDINEKTDEYNYTNKTNVSWKFMLTAFICVIVVVFFSLKRILK